MVACILTSGIVVGLALSATLPGPRLLWTALAGCCAVLLTGYVLGTTEQPALGETTDIATSERIRRIAEERLLDEENGHREGYRMARR